MKNEMLIALFARKGTTKDGKTFYSYLTTLTRKDGTEVKASVHFRRVCGLPEPEKCPCMIAIDRKTANFSTKEFDKEIETDNGTETRHIVQNKLWVTSWVFAGEWVDTSMDDFADYTETETDNGE